MLYKQHLSSTLAVLCQINTPLHCGNFNILMIWSVFFTTGDKSPVLRRKMLVSVQVVIVHYLIIQEPLISTSIYTNK